LAVNAPSLNTGFENRFVVAMAQAKARGLAIDCGCFGGNGTGTGVTWFDLIRDVPLFAAGLELRQPAH